MSQKASGSGASQGSSEGDCSRCGYEKDNRLHQESYWQDKVDPRFSSTGRNMLPPNSDKGMMYTHNYERVVNRQIAANHHEHTTAQKGAGGGKVNSQK